MKELERYKEALQLAYCELHNLACLGGAGDRYGNSDGNVIAADCIAKMRAIIEEVTVYAIIAPSGFIETTSTNEGLQRSLVGNANSPFYGYQVAKLTATYQHPKPQPLERSVSVEGIRVDEHGDLWRKDSEGDEDYALKEHPETCGKTGTLIFTWQG